MFKDLAFTIPVIATDFSDPRYQLSLHSVVHEASRIVGHVERYKALCFDSCS